MFGSRPENEIPENEKLNSRFTLIGPMCGVVRVTSVLQHFEGKGPSEIGRRGLGVVCDRIQVPVLETKTKDQFLYWSRTFFLLKLFSIVFFYEKLDIKHRSTKIISKSLIFGSKFGFRVPFMLGKIPHTSIGNQISPFGMKFWLVTVSVILTEIEANAVPFNDSLLLFAPPDFQTFLRP